jgi:short-subunit dehydrogenase
VLRNLRNEIGANGFAGLHFIRTKVKNKNQPVIWITGASSGIGEALAYAYAKRGAKLILSARRRELLVLVKNNCAGDKADIHILPIDLEFAQQAPRWYEDAKRAFGVPDVLINNGGIGHLGAALDMSETVERKVLEINFWGQVAMSKAVLPDMLNRGSGKIVVISSMLGHYGSAKLAAYAASKHALLGYFESLREEIHGSGVGVLLVSPGFVNTQVTLNSLLPDGRVYNKNSVAQERGMLPEVFAEKLIRAINRNKNYAYFGSYELIALPLKKIWPALFYKLYRFMAERAKKN